MRIHIEDGTSYGTTAAIKSIIDGFGGPHAVTAVYLDVRKTVPYNEENRIPLIVELYSQKMSSCRSIEVCGYMYTCGYTGSGPQDLVDIIKYCEVKFNEDEIYQYPKVMCIYTK
jgi:hypothetical protein